MTEVFYRYRVHPAQVRAFEHAYGATGPWAKLFAQHPGFRRTRLFRHSADAAIYVTIDVWGSKADWDAFRVDFSSEYAALDRKLAMLKIEEHLIGFYDGPEEYRPPLDAQA